MKRKHLQPLDDLLAAVSPVCVVFDCDHTLWHGNVEDFTAAKVTSAREAVDVTTGRILALYHEVPAIFDLLRRHGIPVAVASASPAKETALRLLRAFGFAVVAAEVHPGKKDVHLRAIAAATGTPLDRMLFFDDLPHNIRTAEHLGVGSTLVRGGVGLSDLDRACQQLLERRRGSSLMRAWAKGSTKPTTDAPAEAEPPPPRSQPPPPPPPPPLDAASDWACSACTFVHAGVEATFLQCHVCATPRSAPYAKPSAAEPSGDGDDQAQLI